MTTNTKKSKRRPTVEDELNELESACREPGSAQAREALARALASRPALVAQRAARIARRHQIESLQANLKEALHRFLEEPAKVDPGCRAKTAILEALDYLECGDPSPFLTAANHYQKEPAFGGAVETASALRARAIAGLARIGHTDFLLAAGKLLADSEAPVRQAVMDALVHFGDRNGASLALLKLRLGDPEPMVTLACMQTLLALAPDRGIAEVRALLTDPDEQLRESAALALGQSRHEAALSTLVDALERTVLSAERANLLRAIGHLRDAQARAFLLRVVAAGSRADAEAAVAGLAEQRFEAGLLDQVQAAARQNDAAGFVEKAVRASFST